MACERETFLRLPVKRHLVYIGLLLLGIELVRRLSLTATCYVELRYSPFLIDQPHSAILTECSNRHLTFPFHLF